MGDETKRKNNIRRYNITIKYKDEYMEKIIPLLLHLNKNDDEEKNDDD